MISNYSKLISELSIQVPKNLVDLSIKRVRGTAPTQAFSDFITHSEQGDWAENLLFGAFNKMDWSYIPVRYGKSDKITAGDPGFKEFYNSYQDELDTIGKRPDILLFKKSDYKSDWGDDISSFSPERLASIVPLAIAGFEVRSSAYLCGKFTAKKDRPDLCFTPKVEDLLVVLKWINLYGVPHYYVQVFFDKIYIISFKQILELLINSKVKEMGVKNKKYIGSLDNAQSFVIEKNPKNQYKETIHIYLNNGEVISDEVIEPNLIGVRKELSNGRLLHYISFRGGEAKVNSELSRIITQSI